MENLQASLALCEEKHSRLYRAHEKLQKLNQCLEEKLLNLVEVHHEETTHYSSQVDNLTQSLVEARVYIHQLEDENDRYRNDINAVVQLLQCKPSSFVSPKIGMLPEDIQRKVLGQKNGTGLTKNEKKIIKVQVPSSLSQMDIMYAVDKGRIKRSENDIVSAAIIATILQEREKERNENHSNSRCHCGPRNIRLPTQSVQTQTLPCCTISYSGFICPEPSVPTMAGSEKFQEKPPIHPPVLELKDKPKIIPSNAANSATLASNLQLLSNLTTAGSATELAKVNRPTSLKLKVEPQHKKLSVRNGDDNKDHHRHRSGGQSDDTHWSTTVLVQNPPKRLDSFLGLGHGHSAGDTHKSVSYTPLSQEMDSDESHPSPTPPVSSTSYTATTAAKYQHSQARQQQYYRAQKRSFWTRSSSTTSTETEI